MQSLWDFLAANKDALTIALAIVTSLSAVLLGMWKLFLERWWKKRLRVDVKVFEVIIDPALLLPTLYATEDDDSPLADHRITYQPRDPNRDIQSALKSALSRSRYLLITAPTGYGKTREGGMLAQTMMLEGWRVLRVKTGWLDVPKTLPEELGGNRSRVLVFLDDLNGLFSTGERTQSPRAEQIPLLSQISYHDRLVQMLDMLEGMCTENEVRVIATARSEADQWKLLDFDENDKLWKRYERIELPEPSDTAIIDLLDSATKQADLKANPDDFAIIAHKSDGTYRNILLNLRRWRGQNKEVNKDDLTETLDGSWRDIYERAVKKQPAVKYIYDAMDILQQAGIELLPFLVEPTTLEIWGGNWIQRISRRRHIDSALKLLTRQTSILRQTKNELKPSDGQIEAKRYSISWLPYNRSLTQLLLNLSDRKINTSIYGLSVACYYEKQLEQSYQLINQYIQLNPLDSDGFNVLGILLDDLKRYDEAEAAYRKAIEFNPTYASAYSNLGNTLNGLKRYDEAEAAYRKAIELNPTDIKAYRSLINLLRFELSNRIEDTLPLYEKRIEINPEDFNSYLAISSINKQLGKNISVDHIEKARQFMPEDDWYNRACLESVGNNFDLAFEHLRKAVQRDGFNPAWAWEDPDLEWIRNDPRFVEIVGPKPENKNSES
jgi:tetratricopeptide (TPR) repeat protein